MDEKHILPFMIGAVGSVAPRVNFNRMIEALVIAGVTATVTMYGTTKVLETKMQSLEQRLHQVEQQEAVNTQELKNDLRSVREFVESHILKAR